MSEEEIANFDWSRFMAKECIVFSWATCPKLDVALRCGEHWRKNHGLHFIGVPYIWIKTKLNGEPIAASGPRPRLVKPLDELVLAFSTTPNKRTFPLLSENQVQHVFYPKAMRGEHSSKPPVIRNMIVDLLGDRTRIELFCRGKPAPGWDGWGKECHLN